MTDARSESELITLRKLAEQLAAKRKERTTSVHLLAAVASRPGPASELLRERRLDREGLLKASRSFDEDTPDAIGRALTAARDVSKRAFGPIRSERPTFPEPTGLHLLLALLSDRRSAAHRALVQYGLDLARLRTAAMQIALGVVPARRIPTHAATQCEDGAVRRDGPKNPGVTVPLFPPPTMRRTPKQPASPAQAKKRRGMTPRPAEVVAVPLPKRAVARHVSAVARQAHGGRRVGGLDRARFPTLAAVGTDLTAQAQSRVLDAVIGRDVEIDRVLDVLARHRDNAVCLLGPPGVGKTSVAHGLAHRLAADADDARRLVEVRVSELIAGTGARGALAEKLAAIRGEVSSADGEVILFVDEIHELFAMGASDEAIAELKVALARGELPLIGATTHEDWRRYVESDGALSRRFGLVEIEPPDESDAFLLIRNVAKRLEHHHQLQYTDEAIAACISWSQRYLPGRALPDKAIAVLDLAGARARRETRRLPRGHEGVRVDEQATAIVMAEVADVPKDRLLESDRDRMLDLENKMGERVVGHRDALSRIAMHLRRNAAGLRGRRPIGSFLLLGPTGVGKTETAKAIAEVLFDSQDAMTRLDMSEYAESHAVARLIGAPPGYIGYEAGGQLTETVRRRPYQVILLDEIEKAHRDVLEAFLPVLDEGHLTDGRGRRVDFTNVVIILTSNLGAAAAGAVRGERTVGFASSRRASTSRVAVSEAVVAAARSALPPELFNRFDEVLCYEMLSRSDVAEIAHILLEGLSDALGQRGIRLEIEPAAIDALLDAGGFDPEMGARPMRRTIARLVEAPVAELLLSGQLTRGSVVLLTADDGRVSIDTVPAVVTASCG